MSKLIENKPTKLLSVEEAIIGLKRPLKLYSFIVIGINLMILGFGIYMNFKKETIPEYTSLEACLYGMEQIINNDPKENLLNPKVITDLKDQKFTVDSIHLIKVLSSFSCDVFTKDSKGIRRYLVSLEKNSNFVHKFRILDVKGMKVDSRYQL